MDPEPVDPQTYLQSAPTENEREPDGAPNDAPATSAPASADADADAVPSSDASTDDAVDPADTLSPAVRRLVRQYDLDITGIHGTGPAGRIRVGDVIGMLGGRTETSLDRLVASSPGVAVDDDEPEQAAIAPPPSAAAVPYPPPGASDAGQPATSLTSTVFECDLSKVIAHRKRARQSGNELSLTSYYVTACAEALKAVPEVCSTGPAGVLGVAVATTTGETRNVVIEVSGDVTGALNEQLATIDRTLRAPTARADETALWIHHYGPSGSLLAMPTPIAHGHAASLGIGALRRQIVLRMTDGEEAPRVAAVCYLSLSFLPGSVTLERANGFLARLVSTLEQWPASST